MSDANDNKIYENTDHKKNFRFCENYSNFISIRGTKQYTSTLKNHQVQNLNLLMSTQAVFAVN